MMPTLENNYFLVRTKLGYLWYSVFLNVTINHIQEKEKHRNLIVREKETFLYLNFSSIVTLKKTKIMIFNNFVS